MLARYLRRNRALRDLGLGDNGITDAGLADVLGALKSNRRLVRLLLQVMNACGCLKEWVSEHLGVWNQGLALDQ